ncbi:jhy protein homolog [Rhea pennata]|uniref:jhy protein homolog n=1 Tax=Rhea pennata TaxID=8795 RepID=UPI002E2654B9
MSKSHFPGRVFMQPHFYPANLKRQSVSEGDLAAGLHDSEESDCESLAQERQYQLELQQRIRENEELVGLSSDELENDSLEEDSLEGTTLEEQEGAKCDTDRYTTGMQKNGSNGRKQQSLDKYFNLRYDPNWKNIKDVAEFSEAKKANQVPGRSSMEFSQDSFYLLSNSCPKEKNQEIAKSRDTFSAFDTEVLNFHEPNAMVSNDPFRLYVKGKEAEEDYHFQDSPSTYSSAFSLHIQDRPERTKKDFVAKNIQTLGLGTHAKNSYLQLHSKKQVAVLQEQVADTKAVDEEPVQNVLPFQNMKMDPEDKWPSHSSTCSSPAAPCPASQLTKIMEQHHQEITHFTEAHLTDRHLFNLLPPVITQLESDSELNTERDGGSRVKISRSNSEGYLMEVEKQKQLKVNKKPYSSKAYMNLNVRLGGLGPDYEAIKEKKEKLKQQKEYAKQIKEHNMKNTASVQRLPTKPKVTCSVSRQKALEYAKKIPRPKTFEKRQPDEEVKDERVLSQILRRDHLPQIASLETLQDRHEKEKQVVAAFRTLHIL